MFNSINLKALNKDQYFQFISNAIDLILLEDASKIKIQGPFNLLKAALDDLAKLLTNERKNPLTKEINDLDARRDLAIVGLRMIIDGNTRHKDETIRKYAANLLDNIDSYGSGIANQGLAEETATLKKLHSDWTTKPAIVAGIQALSLSEWVSEIDDANNLLNEKYILRTKQDGNVSDDTLKSKRAQTDKAWDSLKGLIESRYKIALEDKDDVTAYQSIVKSINSLIDKYNVLINSGKKTPEVKPVTPTNSGTKTTD